MHQDGSGPGINAVSIWHRPVEHSCSSRDRHHLLGARIALLFPGCTGLQATNGRTWRAKRCSISRIKTFTKVGGACPPISVTAPPALSRQRNRCVSSTVMRKRSTRRISANSRPRGLHLTGTQHWPVEGNIDDTRRTYDGGAFRGLPAIRAGRTTGRRDRRTQPRRCTAS